MGMRRCLACGDAFRSRPQVPHQAYCSKPECQRARRRLWQSDKRRSDEDYRDNQARAHREWLDGHPDYWKQYRMEHPDYVDKNRTQQKARNAARRIEGIANKDKSGRLPPLASGIYQVSSLQAPGIAKMDAWIVRITVLSRTWRGGP